MAIEAIAGPMMGAVSGGKGGGGKGGGGGGGNPISGITNLIKTGVGAGKEIAKEVDKD